MERASGGSSKTGMPFASGNLSNFERDKVLPLGNDDGRVVFLPDITQRYGKMGRIGDDQCGTRYLLHHAPARAVARDRALARFDDRVALGLLESRP